MQAAPVAEPVAATLVAEPLAEKDGLKISIPPISHGRYVGLRQSDPHINVVLQNTSSKPINIFEEWNSWGYNNLRLEITKVDGKVLDKPLVVRKGMMAWGANFSSAETLAPGDALVREVRLQVSKHSLDSSIPETTADLNSYGALYWGFPVPLKGGQRLITMRAVFANNDSVSDTGMEKKVVWTGQIASPFKDYALVWDGT